MNARALGLLRGSRSSTFGQRSRRCCRDCFQCNSSCSQRSCYCRYCPNRCSSTRSLRALSPLRAATAAAAVDAAQHAIAAPNTLLSLRPMHLRMQLARPSSHAVQFQPVHTHWCMSWRQLKPAVRGFAGCHSGERTRARGACTATRDNEGDTHGGLAVPRACKAHWCALKLKGCSEGVLL